MKGAVASVDEVEVAVATEKPTCRIIHLQDWHHVPKDLHVIDMKPATSRELTDEIDRLHDGGLLLGPKDHGKEGRDMKEGGNTQADAGWERLREVVARRINAQPLPWEVKVEVWEEEMAESETTFAKVLKLCGEFVPE